MKPTGLCIAAAIAALAGLPLAAIAQEGGEMSMFEELDTNKDGAIDLDESARSAQVTADFRQIDQDANGRISQAEWRSYFRTTGTQGASPGKEPGPGPGRSGY